MNDKSKIKGMITKNGHDLENSKSYKEGLLLRERKIRTLKGKEAQKYGLFTITLHEEENFIREILIEKMIFEEVNLGREGTQKAILDHSIYSYERDIDHGKEKITKNDPLVRYLYVDIEKEIFYLETVEGMLYCSSDKVSWFIYLVEEKERPYYQRDEFLRKIEL